jgi:hypothetical protein
MPSEKTSYHPVLSSVKGHNLTVLPRLGLKINSRACLSVLTGSLQLAQCWLFNQRLSLTTLQSVTIRLHISAADDLAHLSV